MTDNDDNLFSLEMGDVKRLNIEKKVQLKRDSLSSANQRARREAATQEIGRDANHLADGHIELLDSYYVLEFKRDGVQHGVFKKLKQGKYAQEARLDLHGMTVEVARKEVFDFIRESASYDLRSLLIVHGKGNHSQSSAALLKSYVNRWLPDMDEVQAFSSAQPHHGGLGAVYVLLRKSERKKQENRDKISKGRIFGAE